MAFMFIVFGLAAFGLIYFFIDSAKEQEKLNNMTDYEKVQYRREQKEREERAKYNNLMYTCPMCSSKKIKSIDTTERGVSVAMFGMSSGKIGKCYECDNCKYKW